MIEEPHLSRQQSAGTSQTSLTAAAIGQSSLGSYGVRVSVSRALRARTSTLH